MFQFLSRLLDRKKGLRPVQLIQLLPSSGPRVHELRFVIGRERVAGPDHAA